MSKLVFGCGYLGRRVAQQWRAAGETVFAVTRSQENAGRLRESGLEPIVADVTRPESLRRLPPAETVLYAVGFDQQSGKSRWEVYVDGLAAVLDAISAETARVIFISSTGVYGDADGQWVDEETPCRPARDAGRAFFAAEQRLMAHPLGGRAIVLRMAGMYGHERLPRRADLLVGTAIPASPDSWLNLIHVDDATAVVIAAEQHANPPCTYVVSDGSPVERGKFFQYMAQQLGAAAPQLVEPSVEYLASHHSGSNKRVNSARMLRDLKVKLACPSYREGLLGGERWRGE